MGEIIGKILCRIQNSRPDPTPTDPSYSVWIQDFYNPDTEKHYALVLNDLETPKKAYLLQGAIRYFYMNHDGPYNYGVPFTGEIKGGLANSPFTREDDFVRPSSFDHPDSQVEPKQIVVQKFKRRKDGEYNNERRTIVHDPETGETGHFPVGQFAFQSSSCDATSNLQMYLYVYGGDDIPWPVDNCLVPTGAWFLKPGSYNFVLHNPDGSQKTGWGLTVPITEGNKQYSGSNENYEENEHYAFNRATMCLQVNNNMPEGKSYSFYPQDGYVGFWFELTDVYYSLDITMKWYEPGGDLFGVCSIITKEPNGEYWKKVRFWRFLEVFGLEKYGAWRVELHVDGQKIDTQRFSLSEYGSGSSYSAPPPESPLDPPENLRITVVY